MTKHEATVELIKAAPPLAVVGTSVSGAIAWQDIAYAMTTLWLAVQILWFIGVRIYRWRNNKPLDTVRVDQ